MGYNYQNLDDKAIEELKRAEDYLDTLQFDKARQIYKKYDLDDENDDEFYRLYAIRVEARVLYNNKEYAKLFEFLGNHRDFVDDVIFGPCFEELETFTQAFYYYDRGQYLKAYRLFDELELKSDVPYSKCYGKPIYHLHRYIPYSYRADEKDEAFRQNIYMLKDIDNNHPGDEDVLQEFGYELYYVAADLCEGNEIMVAMVPSSKANKQNNMIRCIKYMKSFYDERFGDNKCIIVEDGFKRTTDVEASHELHGNRVSQQRHEETIECTLIPYKSRLVIVDDICTTGRQMEVCRQKAMERGFNKKYCYSIVLGQTWH